MSQNSSGLSLGDTVTTPAPGTDFLGTSNAAAGFQQQQQHQPAGSGVSFRGAGATTKTITRKKTRSRQVGGGGAAAAASGAAAISSMPPRPPVPTSTPATATGQDHADEPPSMTRDAAAEATRRAEEFMNAKLAEEERASSSAPGFAPVRDGSTHGHVNHRSGSDDNEDDILAAAKAAAEEAQHMNRRSLSDRMVTTTVVLVYGHAAFEMLSGVMFVFNIGALHNGWNPFMPYLTESGGIAYFEWVYWGILLVNLVLAKVYGVDLC
jgi:hypothetical protein